MKTALLLSGGMDSIAIAFWKRPEVAITLDYGQLPAAAEVRAASAVSAALGIEHSVIKVDLRSLGSGDLAGAAPVAGAPANEWWPFRNQMPVTLAAMSAISMGVRRILIGSLKTDSSHSDGRIEFVRSLSALLELQEGGIALEAPAIELTAPELMRISEVTSDVLAWAHSCHVSDYACGTCRGCIKHYETYRDLGLTAY